MWLGESEEKLTVSLDKEARHLDIKWEDARQSSEEEFTIEISTG